MAFNSGELKRAGYTFAGWNSLASGDGTTYDVGSIYTTNESNHLYTKWSPNTNTSYTVEYYQQDVIGDGYKKVEADTVVLNGTTGTEVEADTKNYSGFHENSTYPLTVPIGTIDGNGSLILKRYYDRDIFTVSFDSKGGTFLDNLVNVRYGTIIKAPTHPEKTDYTFIGWFKDEELTKLWNFDIDQITETITLYASWERSEYRMTKFIPDDVDYHDFFGNSVSIDGDYMIAGARGKGAYVYECQANGSWESETKLLPSSGLSTEDDISVAIDGSYAIVGVPEEDSRGSAYIFRRINGIEWDTGYRLVAPVRGYADSFGSSVSINGDYAIIGSYLNDDNGDGSGSVYIFHRTSLNSWDSGIKINASDGSNTDMFGKSVSISGDYAVVGAWVDCDNGVEAGSVYFYHRTGENIWGEEYKVLSPEIYPSSDNFGFSVSIDGDYAVIGARGADYYGNAYIYHRTGSNTWEYDSHLVEWDGSGSYRYGSSVSIDGNNVIVGAFGDHENGSYSGCTYLYKMTEEFTWEEVTKIIASDGDERDRFGASVALSGNNAIVGAPYDEKSGEYSGSIYTFSIE